MSKLASKNLNVANRLDKELSIAAQDHKISYVLSVRLENGKTFVSGYGNRDTMSKMKKHIKKFMQKHY